jgi:hypothetical protein
VRDDVLKATRNKQEPFKYGSLGGAEIPLVPGKGFEPAAAASPKPAADYAKEMEIAFWNAIKDAKSKELLQTYLGRYPSGNFAGLARVMIEQLEKHLPGAQASPVAKPTDDRADQDKLVRALQTELKRVGCDPGDVDGVWSDKAKRALAEFARLSKVELPNEAPTSEALQVVLGQKDRICTVQCGPHETEKGGRCVAREQSERTRAKVSEVRAAFPTENMGKCGHGVKNWTKPRC